jgi:hypothetical protein
MFSNDKVKMPGLRDIISEGASLPLDSAEDEIFFKELDEHVAEELVRCREKLAKHFCKGYPWDNTTAFYGEDDLENADSTDDCGADERDYPGEARKQFFCDHEYVNVSFTGIKIVCKKCDKPKDT